MVAVKKMKNLAGTNTAWGKRVGAALCTLAMSGAALAAGGHHAVDDAAILDPGACKVESWLERGLDGTRLLHAATGCRVGPVELVGGADYARQSGASQTNFGLAAKWATEIGNGLSVGASLGGDWQARARPRYQGSTVLGLLTWEATDGINLHANVGRDLVHQGDDESRGGLSIDWTVREGWLVMAERYRQEGGHFARVGLRWTPSKDWTVDLSRAHRLRGVGESSWTLGLTREFDR
jgi:hypothetical protein